MSGLPIAVPLPRPRAGLHERERLPGRHAVVLDGPVVVVARLGSVQRPPVTVLASVGPPVSGAGGWLGLPVVLPGQTEVGGGRVGVSPAPASSPGPRGTLCGLDSTAGHHLTSPPWLARLAWPQSGAGAGLTGAGLQPGPLSLLPGLRVLLQCLELGQGDDVAPAWLVPHRLLAAGIVVIEPEHEYINHSSDLNCGPAQTGTAVFLTLTQSAHKYQISQKSDIFVTEIFCLEASSELEPGPASEMLCDLTVIFTSDWESEILY